MEYINIANTYYPSGLTVNVRKRVDGAAAHGTRHIINKELDAYRRRRRKLRRQVLSQPLSENTYIFTLTFRGEVDARCAMQTARSFFKNQAARGITFFAVSQTRDDDKDYHPTGYDGDKFNKYIEGLNGWHLHGFIDGLNTDGINELIDDWCAITGADWQGQYFVPLSHKVYQNELEDDRLVWFNYITRLLYEDSKRTSERLTITNFIPQKRCKTEIDYYIVDENKKKHKSETVQTPTSSGIQGKVPILKYSTLRFRVLLRRLSGACRRLVNMCSSRTLWRCDGKPVSGGDRGLLSLPGAGSAGVRGRAAPAVLGFRSPAGHRYLRRRY